MKRKVVMKLLCVSIASAMLVSNTAVLVAGEETRTAIYNGQQMTVTVNGEQVILPDGQIVTIKDCQFLEEQPVITPAPDQTPGTAPETPDQGTPGTEAPDTEAPGTETPDTENPDTEAPDVETPDTENPDTEAPDVETPDTENPDTEAPDVEVPDTENPDTEAPDAETPDTGNPDTEAPETDASGPVEPSKKPVSGELSDTAESFGSSIGGAPSLSVTSPSLKAGIGFYVDELKDTYHLEFSETFKEMLSEIEEQYIEASVKEAVETAARKAEAERAAAEEAAKKAAEEAEKAAQGSEVGEPAAVENAEAEEPAAEEAPVEEAEPVSKVQVSEDIALDEVEAEDLQISVKNWQDVVAVYLLEQSRAGVAEFKLDASAKGRLTELLGEMNTPTITKEELVCEPQYIDAYIEANKDTLSEQEVSFLKDYTSSSFSLLCAAATGAEGFILESLGEDVTAERAQVVAAGYSLVGKIPYFWGGKSSVVGWDDRWGSPAEVTAAGTSASGTIQNYGLDCSGFVTWAFVNGYENSAATSLIGHGTATQWAMSEGISEEEAMPGDLVFLQQPNAAGINHVGIVVGRNDDGSLIAVHCNAGQNGVTVDSAYQAGFRYVRRPLAYSDDSMQAESQKQERLQELKATIAEENAKKLEASAITK